MSLYDDLGVSPDASDEEIAVAYRKAAKAHHPDKGGDPEAFAKISRAVAVLRDPARRAEYDATGREDAAPDDPEREARDALMQAFASMMMQIVEQGRGGTVDVMARVRASLTDQARQQEQERRKVEAMQGRALEALGRLSCKREGPDVLGNMLNAKIADMDKIKAGMARLAAAFERAAEMAEDWDWRVDTQPAFQHVIPGWEVRGGTVKYTGSAM
jgi:curved DNA-binding protein CbpA